MSRVVGCNKVIRSSANSSIGEEVDRLVGCDKVNCDDG